MELLISCSNCTILFFTPDYVDVPDGIAILCPSCGATQEMFDDVPMCHEVQVFWNLITDTFSLRELNKFRLLGLKLIGE